MAQQRQFAEKLFAHALDLEPANRRAYLDHACQGTPELRRLVDSLLLEDERAGSFLKIPIMSPGSDSTRGNATVSAVGTIDSSEPARFSTGDTIAGRFAVVRFIARGGMGEVYEVEDHLLQRNRVALKMILPQIAADAEASHRFEQEVLLARRINHPNLCPIYEIFRCEEQPPAFLFLTMKLLAGETLEVSLRKNLLLPREEAVEIFRQMIAGIAAIHAAGVIHRDVKPTNVMLDRSGSRLCVSIMDFGLARHFASDATALKPGVIAGTPGYLAPELIRGHHPSRASDIFALGVVLHQVFTGERPTESADGVCVHAAPSLALVPAPAVYIKAIGEFLSEDAMVRCRAFELVRSALDEGSLTQPRSGHASRTWTRRQMLIASSAACCAIAGGAAWQQDRISEFFHPLPLKRFVALVGWPPSIDATIKPMLVGLIDAISSELSRAEAYDHNLFLIPHFSSVDVTTPAQLDEVRESLGANLVLAASGVRSSKDLHVSLSVLPASSSHALRTKQIHVPLDRQVSLPQKVVRAVAELLNITHYEPNDKRTEAGTSDPAAYAAFQTAETLMKQENDTGLEPAIEKYKQAVEIDQHYALAHARLAVAYCRLSYLKHDPAALVLARANAEAALSLNPGLVPARIALAGVFEQRGDEAAGLREMKRALALDPTNTQTLIWLGQSYVRLNRWQDAEEAFGRALQQRPNDWLAHNELGVLLYMQGKYRQALSEFRTASLASPKDAMTLSNVGLIYLLLGRFPEALGKLKESLNLKRSALASALMSMLLRSRHDPVLALPFAAEATTLDPGNSTMWLELGDCESTMKGHKGAARDAYAEAARVQHESLDVDATDGRGWILLALYEAKIGASEQAHKDISKAESLPSGDVDSQLSKARAFEVLGRREEALNTLLLCLKRGVTSYQVDLMPEMEQLKSDPRYRKAITDGAFPRNI